MCASKYFSYITFLLIKTSWNYPSEHFQITPHPQLSLEFSALQRPSDVIFNWESDKVQLSATQKTYRTLSLSQLHQLCVFVQINTISYLIGSNSISTGRGSNMEKKREKGRLVNLKKPKQDIALYSCQTLLYVIMECLWHSWLSVSKYFTYIFI